jgi:hypothetical protein
MREYLNQRYRVVGRVVVPLLFAGLIAPDILQRVTWIPRWALDATYPIAIFMVLLAFGRIRCPRCHRALGLALNRRRAAGVVLASELHGTRCATSSVPTAVSHWTSRLF